MIARLPPFCVLWRIMAWIGVKLSEIRALGRNYSGGWRDKRAYGCGGCMLQKSSRNAAIQKLGLLAAIFQNLAIKGFLEPSPFAPGDIR